MPLAAVIFDYGKVLCLPQPLATVHDIVARLGASTDCFHEAYAQFREAYDRGVLDDVTYWQAVARHCGQSVDAETAYQLADLDARGWSHPNQPLVAWAVQVRAAGFKTGILSNMQQSLRRRLPVLCPWLPTVDVAVFSSDLGVVKPEPEIYGRVLAALDVRPEQALFIDDVETNTAAARQVGMVALRFTDLPALAQSVAAFPELPPLDVPQTACATNLT